MTGCNSSIYWMREVILIDLSLWAVVIVTGFASQLRRKVEIGAVAGCPFNAVIGEMFFAAEKESCLWHSLI